MEPLIFASAYRQLKPAQKAFVDAYVADTERKANRAGERVSLALHRAIPSDVVAQSRGMLEMPMVLAAITERINDIAAQNELTPHRIVKEYMATAFSSIGDYMEVGEDGQPWFDLTKCTPEQLSAVKSIKVEENGGGMSRPTKRKFEFVLHDKLTALGKLAEYVGLLAADNPHWRAENAKPVGPTALPGDASVDTAQDVYAAMINGDRA